jgi:predicted ATPase
MDIFSFRSLASFVSQTNIALPSGDTDCGDELWNTAELLRVDAELTLHNDPPGAGERAEKILLRSLRIARRQFALSWELRTAVTLSFLWHARGRTTEARDLLEPVYRRFTEGFETKDLMQAKSLLDTLK